MNQQRLHWQVLENAEAVAREAVRRILKAAQQAIAERGVFRIVLAGGRTPERAYGLLAASASDWSRWEVYYGDERCLPREDPERNSVLAARALLDHVGIPTSQVHAIQAHLGPLSAARLYGAVIENMLPFDLVLLGMGEDGHTASLFPGQQHPPGELVHAVFASPKPPPERVSLSAKALGHTRELLFLITGAGKREAVAAWRRGRALPVAGIHPGGRGEVLIDRAAFGDDD